MREHANPMHRPNEHSQNQRSVLAAALGMTCVDPKDDPALGHCRAGRHIAQAERVIKLLHDQGYRLVHVSELAPS